MKYIALVVIMAMSSNFLLFGQKDKEPIKIEVKDSEKKVDIIVDGELFTSYIYPDMLTVLIFGTIQMQSLRRKRMGLAQFPTNL